MTGPILHYSQVRSQPASGDKQKDSEQGEDEAEGELGGEDVASGFRRDSGFHNSVPPSRSSILLIAVSAAGA